jgi:hypothetical protein
VPTQPKVNKPYDCPDCGKVHPRGCHAHRVVTNDEGETERVPCRKAASTGLQVCRAHGGANPHAAAKSAKARTELKAAREVARFGKRVTVHPAEALVDLVHWTAGEVAYWREKVAELEAESGVEGLTWGRTMEVDKRSGEFPGTDTTEEAKPAAAYAMMVDASNRLAAYAAAALRAGVDERRVQLAERQGSLVAGAIRAILDALDLTPAQWELVPTVVPAQLRLLTAARQEMPA